MDGIPLDPFKQDVLTREQCEQYLERIDLPRSLLVEAQEGAGPSVELLSKLLLHHLEHVPKDTTPLHVVEREWHLATSSRIKLGRAFTNMPEGVSAFDRIVTQRKGAFCFAINATFSALLRAFGFRVSELVGRTFKSLGNDPLTHPDGYKWGTLTHEVMLADWPGSDARYLVDGAWGPWAAPVPIKLVDGEIVRGLNDYEAFQLVRELLPLSASSQTRPIDESTGWTFSRLVSPPGVSVSSSLPDSPPSSSPGDDDSTKTKTTTTTTGYWTPLFHFKLESVPLLDFRLYHHFSASHELASFTAFWLVTKLIPGTGGARRSMMYAEKEGGGTKAKVYTTGGHDAKGSLEGRDVEWVEMETHEMKAYLKKEFGFGF